MFEKVLIANRARISTVVTVTSISANPEDLEGFSFLEGFSRIRSLFRRLLSLILKKLLEHYALLILLHV